MSKKFVARTRLKTLHEEVSHTIAEIRERFCISKLRHFTKRVTHKCYGCKRFRACPAAVVGDLPLDHTSGSRQFQMIGLDFTRPLIYIKKGKQEGKTYILVYSCNLIRAVYMDLMRDQSLEEFLTILHQFIARRGRP